MKIDDILGYFIHVLDPCVEECLNLYQPEKWSELRWIISGLLGFVTIIPIVNFQIWNFSKPGLTHSEKKMLRIALILAPLMFLIFSYISIVEILPMFYGLGHDVHTDYGFVVKYDAISLVYFASIVLWAQVLVIVSASVMISSGITGNLDSDNANQLHNIFFDLRNQLNCSFVIVTHNNDLAKRADRLINLKDGQIK